MKTGSVGSGNELPMYAMRPIDVTHDADDVEDDEEGCAVQRSLVRT